MKPLAGLLVEYLVIGAVALLWLIPMFASIPLFSGFITSKDTSVTIIALVVPAIYVIGMVCDYLGYKVTHLAKEKINRAAWEDQIKEDPELKLIKPPGSQLIHVYAVCYEPELAEAIEARSSRDRVARGSLIAFFPVVFLQPASYPLYLHLFVAAVVILSLAMLWGRFQKLSSKYEAKALCVLREKHKLNLKVCAQPKD